MKLTENTFTKIAKSNGFNSYDIKFILEDLFENAEEVSLDLIIEKVMINVQNTIHSQTYLETSGDIAYIVAYLEKYKGLIVDLEDNI